MYGSTLTVHRFSTNGNLRCPPFQALPCKKGPLTPESLSHAAKQHLSPCVWNSNHAVGSGFSYPRTSLITTIKIISHFLLVVNIFYNFSFILSYILLILTMHFICVKNCIMIFYNFRQRIHLFLPVFVTFRSFQFAIFLFAYVLIYNTYPLFFISFSNSSAFFLLLFRQIRVYY